MKVRMSQELRKILDNPDASKKLIEYTLSHKHENADGSVDIEVDGEICNISTTANLNHISNHVERLDKLEAENKRLNDFLNEIIDIFVDDDPCVYDHHGYCQTHYHSEKPCIIERLKELKESK